MTTLDELPLREELRALRPYGAPQLDVPVRLNTNENPHPPPAALADDLGRAANEVARTLNRYPDRDATEVRAALAAHVTADTGVAVRPEQVWAANGSNEVQQQLLQAFGGPGRTALGFTPGYSMHRLLALGTATAWREEPRRLNHLLTPWHARRAVDRHEPTVVLLAGPNNPTGTALPLDVVTEVLDAPARPVVVVDEAYAEFRRPGTPSAVQLLDGHPRLVVTRTMSKAFAYAGARVGYLVADPAVVDAVLRVRLPYHLSALTQAAALVALRHRDALLAGVDAVRVQRDRLVAEVRRLGLHVGDSDANFVLAEGLDDAAATFDALLRRGVLVRDVSGCRVRCASPRARSRRSTRSWRRWPTCCATRRS